MVLPRRASAEAGRLIALDIVHHVFGMAWKIAWGLVLGFAISGVVQAFVSKERVAEHLGGGGPRSLLLATGFGMASSSCSYAAAAMSKSLFGKGAHIVAATAFLFASTNLVVEIGIVIWTLLGWRFVLAELVGGIVLIVLAAVLLRTLFRGRLVDEARRHLEEREPGDDHERGEATLPWSELPSRAGIAAVGRYFAADWRMIGKDIALGLAIAGTLAAVVPRGFWEALFLASAEGVPDLVVGVENAVVGPLIAILSFVCSVGNIPLAAVLWSGGISFGGVVAFIFADLVTIPMVLVYRRYYGWRPALAYAATLLATIVVAALVVEAGFALVGLVPPSPPADQPIARDYFAWDYTTWLNLVLLPAGVALAWLGSQRG